MIDQTLLESDTRKEIDRKLVSAGWVIQEKSPLGFYEIQRVASMIGASTPFLLRAGDKSLCNFRKVAPVELGILSPEHRGNRWILKN